MTQGNLELVEILAYWAVVGPAMVAVVRRDERRLLPEQAARAWPPVSRDAAFFLAWMVGLNPVLLLLLFAVHFVRTRGLLAGLVRALLWTCAVVAPGLGVVYAVDVLFGSAG